MTSSQNEARLAAARAHLGAGAHPRHGIDAAVTATALPAMPAAHGAALWTAAAT